VCRATPNPWTFHRDINRDGTADILSRDRTDGNVHARLLHGATRKHGVRRIGLAPLECVIVKDEWPVTSRELAGCSRLQCEGGLYEATNVRPHGPFGLAVPVRACC
jgi:hypothetical protein